MNRLYVGLSKEVELPDGGFLFIDDEIPDIPDWKRLIAQFKGQLVLPKFGFYGRDAHVNLIEEDRLIAGINTLAELSPLLRQNMLLVPEKVASGAIVDDAEELAKYERLARGTNGFVDFTATKKPSCETALWRDTPGRDTPGND